LQEGLIETGATIYLIAGKNASVVDTTEQGK
jgi:hypothetical protein